MHTVEQSAQRTGRVEPGRLVATWASHASVRLLALVALLAFMPLLFLKDPFIADVDLGFHLRTGDWVLAHHAVPRIETFSSYAAGKPWVAYSWLYEAMLALLYRWQKLVGIVIYAVVMRVAVAVALWSVLWKLSRRFWLAIFLTAPALFVIGTPNGPRPVFCSIVLLLIVFGITLAQERAPRPWHALVLISVFVLWADLHLQFTHGLAILGSFAIDASWSKFRSKDPETARPKWLWSTLLACAAATLINPYGIGVWQVIWRFFHQPKLYDLIIEMQAPTFRHPEDYVTLLLVLGAAFAMGRARRIRPALFLLFLFAVEQAFRSEREIWFAAVISTAIIADAFRESDGAEPVAFRPREWFAAVLCTLALILVGGRVYNVNNDFLEMQLHGRFPEVAVRFIEQNHLHGRLFNDYGWGGYLMWRMPEMQVAIDGRANNVHDQDHVERAWKTWRGKPGWQNDPELNAADIVIGRIDYPLTDLLRNDPRFKLVHEDREAVVFVHIAR